MLLEKNVSTYRKKMLVKRITFKKYINKNCCVVKKHFRNSKNFKVIDFFQKLRENPDIWQNEFLII